MAFGSPFAAATSALEQFLVQREAERRQRMLDEILQQQHARAGEVHDLKMADTRRSQYGAGDVMASDDVEAIRRFYPALVESQQTIPARVPAMPVDATPPQLVPNNPSQGDGVDTPTFRTETVGAMPPSVMTPEREIPSTPTGATVYRGDTAQREARAKEARIAALRHRYEETAATDPYSVETRALREQLAAEGYGTMNPQQDPSRPVPVYGIDSEKKELTHAGDIPADARTFAVTRPAASQSIQGMTAADADAYVVDVVAGRVPPVWSARVDGPMLAAIARYNRTNPETPVRLEEMRRQWRAVERHISTLNNEQHQRVQEVGRSILGTAETIEDLLDEWKTTTGLPFIDKHILNARIAAGDEAATRLNGYITDLQLELSVLYRSGLSPTDSSIDKAEANLKTHWTEAQLRNGLELIKRQTNIRLNAAMEAGPRVAGNQHEYRYGTQAWESPMVTLRDPETGAEKTVRREEAQRYIDAGAVVVQ